MELDEMLNLLKKLNQNWFDYPISNYNRTDDYGEIPTIPFFSKSETNNLPNELKYLYRQRFFQRLNYIKQLSFIYLFNLGGCHSRLEHTLGTLIIGKKFLKECMKNNTIKIEDYEKLGLYVALFLHDSCHGPFGHSLELIKTFLIPDNRSGERIDKILIKKYLRDPNNKIRQAIEEISPIDKEKFIGFIITLFVNNYDKKIFLIEILNSLVDADRLDYIMRDRYHIGLKSNIRTQDLDDLFSNAKIFTGKWDGFKNKLVFSDSIKPILDDLIDERAKMYNEFYHGEKSKIADTMLPHVIYQFLDDFELIIQKSAIKDIRLKKEILSEILKLTDQDFIRFLYFVGKPWYAINLLDRLLTGNIYISIKEWNVFNNIEKIEEELREIEVLVKELAKKKELELFEADIQEKIEMLLEAFKSYKKKNKTILFETYLFHFLTNCIKEIQGKVFSVELNFWNNIISKNGKLRQKIISVGGEITGDERGKEFIGIPQVFFAIPTYIPPYKDLIKFNYLPKEAEKSVPTLIYDKKKGFRKENFEKYFEKGPLSQHVKSYSTYLIIPDYLEEFKKFITEEFKTYIKSLNWWIL